MQPFAGSDLQRLRRRFGKNKAQMAEEFAVSRNTWGRWEAGGELDLLLRYALTAWSLGLGPVESGDIPADAARPAVAMTAARRAQLAKARAARGGGG